MAELTKEEKKEIVKKLLDYGEKIKEIKDKQKSKYSPLAVLLGCHANRVVDVDIVWKISGEINNKDKEFINKTEEEWDKFLMDIGYNYHRARAKDFVNAIDIIKNEDNYNGDISKLWNESNSYAEIISKLLKFQGMNIKLATMTAKILKRDGYIKRKSNDETFKDDEYFMDISPDTHVCHVFRTLGLIDNSWEGKSKEKQIVTYTARYLNPDAPYNLDDPCFNIGKNFCHKKGKRCFNKDEQKCPMFDICKDRIKNG